MITKVNLDGEPINPESMTSPKGKRKKSLLTLENGKVVSVWAFTSIIFPRKGDAYFRINCYTSKAKIKAGAIP